MAYPPPPYADAVCGTPVCGEAITGEWWVYPLRGTLTLNGLAPTIVLPPTGPTVAPDRALLTLSGRAPDLAVASTVSTSRGTLTFVGLAPTLSMSSALPVARGVLTLRGVGVRFVGQVYLFEIDCIEDDLVASSCGEVSLSGASESDLVLVASDCR
jgi:hypothetical protein